MVARLGGAGAGVEAAVRPDVELSHRLVRARGRRPRGRLQRQRHPGGAPWCRQPQLSEHLQEFAISTWHPYNFGKTRKNSLQQFGKTTWHQ